MLAVIPGALVATDITLGAPLPVVHFIGGRRPAEVRLFAARHAVLDLGIGAGLVPIRSALSLGVARFVAHGRTIADIAKELYIGTVRSHISNIVAKLDERNRVGIAAWAWEHGIAPPSDHT